MSFLSFFRKADEEEKKRRMSPVGSAMQTMGEVSSGVGQAARANFNTASAAARGMYEGVAAIPRLAGDVLATPGGERMSAIGQTVGKLSQASKDFRGAAADSYAANTALVRQAGTLMPRLARDVISPRAENPVATAVEANASATPQSVRRDVPIGRRIDASIGVANKAQADAGRMESEANRAGLLSISDLMNKKPETTNETINGVNAELRAQAEQMRATEKEGLLSIDQLAERMSPESEAASGIKPTSTGPMAKRHVQALPKPIATEVVKAAGEGVDKKVVASAARGFDVSMKEVAEAKRRLEAQEKMSSVSSTSGNKMTLKVQRERLVAARQKYDEAVSKTTEKAANTVLAFWNQNPKNVEQAVDLMKTLVTASSYQGTINTKQLAGLVSAAGLPFDANRLVDSAVNPATMAAAEAATAARNADATATTADASMVRARAEAQKIASDIARIPADRAEEREKMRQDGAFKIAGQLMGSPDPGSAMSELPKVMEALGIDPANPASSQIMRDKKLLDEARESPEGFEQFRETFRDYYKVRYGMDI